MWRDFVLYILPFSLVSLRTFRLVHGLVRCNMRTRRGCVIQRYRNKNPRWKIWPEDVNDVMHRKRARRILGIWEKSVSWVLASEEEGWLSGLAEIRRVVCSGVPRVVVGGGADGKVSIERLCITLLMSKNLLTQSFAPELRSRKCFSCFGIPMLSIYELWTFYVRFTYPYHGYVT